MGLLPQGLARLGVGRETNQALDACSPLSEDRSSELLSMRSFLQQFEEGVSVEHKRPFRSHGDRSTHRNAASVAAGTRTLTEIRAEGADADRSVHGLAVVPTGRNE